MDIKKYYGPPGTGKTTQLVKDVIKEVERGTPPERIGYVAFTRAAAHEVRARLIDAGLDQERLRFFSTIHSVCYRLLELSRTRVFSTKAVKEFRARSRYQLSVRPGQQDPTMPIIEGAEVQFQKNVTADDMIYFIYQLARQLLVSPKQIARPPYIDVHHIDYIQEGLEDFVKSYKSFKEEYDLVDFTDMLELALQNRLYPKVDVLFLDEAQDLTPLQWQLFDMWRELAQPKRTYIAGDDDQCIYDWAGASPRPFLNYPGKEEVLQSSYRVPIDIVALARRLIEKNKTRKAKDWRSATGLSGEIRENQPLQLLLESLEKNQDSRVFLLTRVKYLLAIIVKRLRDIGIPYTNLRGDSPMANNKSRVFRAVTKRIPVYTAEELEYLTRYIPSQGYWKHGAKTKIKQRIKQDRTTVGERNYSLSDIAELGGTPKLVQALQNHDVSILGGYGFTATDREYYYRVHERFGSEAFEERPKVTLGTIHSVKGREADIVAIWPNITEKIWGHALFPEGREAERRVWYVGITRAKKELWLMEPLKFGYVYNL